MENSVRKQLLLWLHSQLHPISYRATEVIAHRYGSAIGFIYVWGYPKSGTSWVSQLVSHYLDVPFIKPFPMLPQTYRCVVHHHWNYHPAFDRSIFVIRDGRDVMVSSYMTVMRLYATRMESYKVLGNSNLVRWLVLNRGKYNQIIRRLHHLYGKEFDPWNVEGNLPRYLQAELEEPFRWAVSRPWPQYVREWLDSAKNTIFVKYEHLLENPVAALTDLLARYTQEDIDVGEVEYAVRRYAFERQAGRSPGEEDRASFYRKGVRGDWGNYFSPEAARMFDHHAGDLLVELGYEPDHNWVGRGPVSSD